MGKGGVWELYVLGNQAVCPVVRKGWRADLACLSSQTGSFLVSPVTTVP